jgi:hypothetical protein
VYYENIAGSLAGDDVGDCSLTKPYDWQERVHVRFVQNLHFAMSFI